MPRTTAGAVKDILGKDFDPNRSLTAFIDTASATVDDLVSYAQDSGITTPAAARLELIERWLAAHYYTRSDRIYTNNSTLRSSGSYALGQSQTPYLDAAKDLDPTGYLLVLQEDTGTPSVFWGGKTRSEQLDYEDRQ